MTRRRSGYSALGNQDGRPRRWWERVPRPLAHAALRAWSAVPHAVRAPFIPLGRWINPAATTSASAGRGPDTVAGVTDLRAQGFEPLEEYTGATWVGQLWPDDHRRSVAETRSAWLDDPHGDGRLWLARSPWPALTLGDSLNVLWTWVERDHAELDDGLWRERVVEALRWDEERAVAWHRHAVDPH